MIVPEEAVIVQQVFHWIGQERLSIGEIARRLSAAEIPTRRGKARWDRTTIWLMLRNPAYKGQAAFGKTRSAPRTPALRPQRGQPLAPRHAASSRDCEAADWLYIPVPALVDEALWAAVQEQLAENRQRARQGRRGARYLLQGLTVCAQCGYAYYGKAVGPGGRKPPRQQYAYYRCTGSDAQRVGGERICFNRQIRTDYLEAAVWEQVQQILADPQRIAAEYRDRSAGPGSAEAAEQARVANEIARLKQGIGRLIDGYAEGLLAKDEFEPRLGRLRERLARVEEQAAGAQAVREQAAAQQKAVEQLEAFARQVQAGLATADWETKRELICALVKRVAIDEQEVQVVLRIGAGPPGPAPDILQDCRRSENPLLAEEIINTGGRREFLLNALQ